MFSFRLSASARSNSCSFRRQAEDQAFGVSDLVLSGFVRIVTSQAIFKSPTGCSSLGSLIRGFRRSPQLIRIRAIRLPLLTAEFGCVTLLT